MRLEYSDQLEKAKMEDMLVEVLYGTYQDLVFHGGTAIWRCYGGNRFSRDLDFYYKIKADEDQSISYKEMREFLKGKGFAIKSGGYNKDTDTFNIVVEGSEKVKMKIDVNFKYKRGSPAEYLNVDDSKTIVLSLRPEELLNEKLDAYEDKFHNTSEIKKPEAQDLYDIYYLTTLIAKPEWDSVTRVKRLIMEIKDRPPPDMGSLGHVILYGVSPTFDFLIERITTWSNEKRS